MSWHFLQEQAEASWEAGSLDGAPDALLRLIPTAGASSWPDNATESLNRSPSGTTSSRSTDDHGEEQSTSFPVDSHAKTSAPPARGGASPENEADSGKRWPASFAKYDHASHSWKTHQYSLLGDLESFLATWPIWGLMRDGECFRRPIPSGLMAIRARIISAKDSGSLLRWQTPVADDSIPRKQGKFNSRGEPKLSAQVIRWPTPCAMEVAKDLQRHDAKRSLPRSIRGGGNGDNLSTAVARTQAGGQLNPTWVEWLMGWPIGWTELKPLETDKFLAWLRSHGGF